MLVLAFGIPREVDATTVSCTIASPCSLSNLISSNESFQVGDKLFSGFSTSNVNLNQAQLFIAGVTVNGMEGLQITNNFTVVPLGGTLSSVPGFQFNMTVTDPTFLVHDVSGQFITAPTGTGSLFITDTLTDPNTATTLASGTLSSVNGVLSGYHSILSSDVSSVHFADVLNATGPISFPWTGQLLFSQVAVPEPSSVLLLGSGLAGLGMWRRIKRA